MNNEVKVSIITVCYNSEKTIRQTIESVLNQTYDNIEYIVVDGKSKDGTINIIDEYIPKFGGRMIVISEKDQGIYDAMNKGINHATGELVGIINSDDWYEKDAVEKMVEKYISINKDVIIYGALRYILDEEEESVRYYSHKFLKERMISHPTCFVSKEIYNRLGVFDLNYRIIADYDFMLRAFESNILFEGIREIVANFRIGGTSNTRETDEELIELYYKHGIYSSKEYHKKKVQMAHWKTKQKIKGFFRLSE